MKKTIALMSLVLFMLSLHAQDLDMILNRYYDAIGLEKLQKTDAIIMTGRVIQMDNEIPMKMYQKRPKKIKMEAKIKDGTEFVQAYDGENGWAIMPWTGSSEPRDLDSDQMRVVEQMSDIEGDLYNWEEKKFVLTLEGSDKLNDTGVFKLKLIKPSGDEFLFYLDKKKYIILREDTKVERNGAPFESIILFKDFKPVEGMVMPFEIETKMNGQVVSKFIIEDVEINPQIDDSIFEKPGTRQ